MAKKKNDIKLRIIPLGGVGEIGKNMTAFEYGDDIIVVDCGLAFPKEDMLGIDYVIPDASYLEENREKVRAFVITHGHEDHIGAVPYILPNFDVPLYATRLTLALINNKLEEHEIAKARLIQVSPGQRVKAGVFSIEFIQVCHSIDDAVALAISTPVGMVIHTGDFKIDYTPVNGKTANLNRIAELGAQGVLALLSDSTNVEREGVSLSEKEVSLTFEEYFSKAKGRIIVTTFASNIHRLQQVVDKAKIYNRKICIIGRSMVKIVELAGELGYLKIPDNIKVDASELSKLKDNKIVILTTGSQGEDMSGLARMSAGEVQGIQIKKGDLVILSASTIPGNEVSVNNVVNLLFKKGASVVNERTAKVHVTGHACSEELKLMLSLVKPQYFIPVHGEIRHLHRHAMLAENIGINPKNIFIPEIGNVIEFSKSGAAMEEQVSSGSTLIDGLGIGDIGSAVIKERKQLSRDGVVIALAYISKKGTKREKLSCEIISRGFVYVKASEDIYNVSEEVVCDAIYECRAEGIDDEMQIKNRMRKRLQSYLYSVTERNPMIIPVLIEK